MSSIALYCYVHLCILSSTHDITQKNSERERLKALNVLGKDTNVCQNPMEIRFHD